MSKTGHDVLNEGLYTSDCCNFEMAFKKGDCFCRCPKCLHLCNWELEETAVPNHKADPHENKAA